MAAAIPSNGIILTQLELTKIVQKDKLKSKIGPGQSSKKPQILIDSAIKTKYSVSTFDLKASYTEFSRLKRSFKNLESIWNTNSRLGLDWCTDVSSEIFLSHELFPSLFPSAEVQVCVGYVKRYLENSE